MALQALTNLEYLDLTRCTAAVDINAQYIGRLSKLTHLQLEYCDVSDYAMFHIANLRKLERLNLCGTHVSDEGLGHLSTLSNLTELLVGEMDRATIDGLRQVPCMQSLTSWDLERALGFR